MAIPEPTIEQVVYDNIPFLQVNSDNNGLILRFTSLIMAELYKVFGITQSDMLDLTKYDLSQKSLMADLVCVKILTRKSILNAEGNGTISGTGNKVLKKAKAGEAETEFHQVKAADGTTLLQNADSLIKRFMDDASRKARSMGFILDIAYDGQFVVTNMSNPNNFLQSVNWD